MLDFSHLTRRFGSFTAVDDLSFDVHARQATALWGPNGAGKTTVIKCLLGLLRYQGQIIVAGLDAQRNGQAVRRQLGYVPQELAFYADMGTLETAQFYARLKRVPLPRAAAVLDDVGLSEHAAKRVGTLSGGMKQRLALALALLADPPILVLDEPTANLDAAARGQFLALLRSVQAAGKTVLFTSHRLEEIETLADEVVVMDRGRLQLVCPAAELAARLHLRSAVKLHLPAAQTDLALHALAVGGFVAHRNGSGIVVEVAPGQKVQPIHLLRDAAIEVLDFEVQ